jgi:predicted nuclease of restriction endonuclease-like (RecB) superfamily
MLPKHKQTILQLKSAILASRYKAASLVNKELLLLYYSVGELISIKTEEEKWGAKVLAQIATDLQNELPGLRGFSATSLKKMRSFYETWQPYFSISPLPTDQLKKQHAKYINTLKNNSKKQAYKELQPISPLLTDQFKLAFLSLAFTHHYEILLHTKTFEERIFYITQASKEFWSVEVLKNKIAARYFKKAGKIQNNFSTTIANETLREKALQTFKDEYLLDFLNIQDIDIEDERVIESEIVRNIKKFILSIGADFAFMGNQYRLVIDQKEFFVDLLFYNRKLQCLVAFELKRGEFKPEYLGKLNFYLSALDDIVKQPHENPSIGVILCKSKSNKIVEYAFRDFNKAMGVAIYKTSKELPKKYKGILPDAEQLKKLLD